MRTRDRKSRIAASSFYLPLRLCLSPRKYKAIRILYDFCHTVDSVVDDANDPGEAKHQLQAWRDYIDEVGDREDPLRELMQHYSLLPEHFHGILDAMEMDLRGEMVRPSLATLTLYCYRAAGCVGLLSIAIFGCTGSEAEAFAVALGHALQLTNILRDIREDAARGRLYLPLEWLEAEGIDSVTPETLHHYPAQVERVCMRLAQQAEKYFAEAERLSHSCNRRQLLPALAMRDMYHYCLQYIVRRGNVLASPRVRIRFWRKLVIAMKTIRILLRRRIV